jgi:hypothetical protein
MRAFSFFYRLIKKRSPIKMARSLSDDNPYQDKLLKLIPTEIVGAYMFLSGVVSGSPDAAAATGSTLDDKLIMVVFFALLALTPLYLWRVSNVTNIVQIIVTTISFVVWVYTLGGPFSVWQIYNPLIGSVVLVIWTLAMPLLVPSTQQPAPAATA